MLPKISIAGKFQAFLMFLAFPSGATSFSEELFKKLRKFDLEGGFSSMEYPQSLWYGVLYDPNKKRVQVAGKDLAAKLLIYILGGIEDRMERAELRKALADARSVEDKTVGFDGQFVEPKEVGLPSVL